MVPYKGKTISCNLDLFCKGSLFLMKKYLKNHSSHKLKNWKESKLLEKHLNLDIPEL